MPQKSVFLLHQTTATPAQICRATGLNGNTFRKFSGPTARPRLRLDADNDRDTIRSWRLFSLADATRASILADAMNRFTIPAPTAVQIVNSCFDEISRTQELYSKYVRTELEYPTNSFPIACVYDAVNIEPAVSIFKTEKSFLQHTLKNGSRSMLIFSLMDHVTRMAIALTSEREAERGA
jgi:hypothetical protein